MGLRNLPTDQARPLASLVQARPGQVASIALTAAGSCCDAMLLSFSAAEEVSEEAYPGDTLYYLVEGAAVIDMPDARVPLAQGECLAVPAGVEHAVRSDGGAFKVLQITVP